MSETLVIKVEKKYENDKPGESSVEYAVREAKCEDPEAEEAKKEAQTLIDKLSE